MDPSRPIIVLTVPRSGSQLLRALLNAHPDVLMAADSDLLGHLVQTRGSLAEIGRVLEEEYSETFRTREHLLAFSRQMLLAFWTTTGEAAHLGKQHPGRWGWVEYLVPPRLAAVPLHELFPHAHFVHLVRDGRNVVASWLANWRWANYGMPPVERNAAGVARLWVEWLAAAKEYPAYALRLEDLSRPGTRVAALAGLLAHLDIAPTPELEQFAAALPWINSDKQTLERWRTDLDAASLERAQRVPGFLESLRNYGYAP